MPEESIETTDLKEQIEKGVEAAVEHEIESGPRWTMYLSLSTAIIAVFAAIASLESGSNSNEAILEKNEAVLYQSQASDRWAYYQAKGIKAAVNGTSSKLVANTDSGLSAQFHQEAQRQRSEQAEIEKSAHELEAKVIESNAQAQRLLERHHRFAICVTLLQIAIALCAISALTKRRTLWYVGLLATAVGLLLFARGFWIA